VEILRLRTDDGDVTLLGTKVPTGWRFARARKRISAAGARRRVPNHPSDWIDNWDEALADLSRSPWYRMTVIAIHAEFRDRVWTAVWERHARRPLAPETLERWLAYCDVV